MITTMITLLATIVFAAVASDGSPREEVLKWREQREARLKSDTGWLTLAGLFWLKEGDNRFGADPGNEIALPEGSAPARAGVLAFHDGRTVVTMAPGVEAAIGGKPVSRSELKPDSSGSPDILALGRLTMQVIKRGDKYGIRLKDTESKARKEFTGLRWYPIDDSYRVTARFVPYDPPRMIMVPTVLGTTEEMPCPGKAVFTIKGREMSLEPVIEEPGAEELFYIFKDETSGEQTYPAGRFFYTAMPKDGSVVLDFNKAYNPPCAFTPYATCPLPPAQNRLKARIEAGELNYEHH